MNEQYNLEMVVLAGIWSNEKIDLSKYDREMFTDNADKYEAIVKYRKDGNPPGDLVLSPIKLGGELSAELARNMSCVTEATIDHYVKELAILRFKQRLYKHLSENTLTKDIMEEGLKVFSPVETDGNLYDMSGDLHDYLNNIQEHIDGKIPMYDLGMPQLDKHISPLEAGMFLIIKALKKTGKTNFAMRLFINMITREIPSIYLTSEMGYYKLIDKVVAILGDQDAHKLRTYKLNKEEQANVSGVVGNKVAGRPGWIYKSGMFDIDKISELVTITNAKVLFIDYLQMFHVLDDEHRTASYEKIACQIKDIAMKRDIVCIGLSQVNKEGDTKNCLSFEEKADQVISLKTVDDTDPLVKTLEARVELNRYGTTGSVPMGLLRRTCNMYEIGDIPAKKIFEPKEHWATNR